MDDDSNGWYVPISLNEIFQNLQYPDVKSADEFSISTAGLEFIKQQEGFYPQLYNDGNLPNDDLFYDITGLGTGNCTIGYGHLVHGGPCNGSDQEDIFKNGISEGDASNLMLSDIEGLEIAVQLLILVPITQYQYDALVSLAYNWGGENLAKSDKIKLLNQKDYVGAGLHFLEGPITSNGVRMPGLVKRRALESAMFLRLP